MVGRADALPRRFSTAAGMVSAAFDGPSEAGSFVVLAHGAGAGLESDYMAAFARGLAQQGRLVCRFNFPYIERGRKTPDRQDVLEDVYRSVVQDVAERSDRPPVLGGKSLGGRIASHVVASGAPAAALVFLGYPLHPPGRPDRLRAQHLRKIRVPMLFVQGTRDPFCPLDTLEEVLTGLDADAQIAAIDEGDHSLKVRKSSGRSTRQAWDEGIDAVHEWLGKVLE